MDWTAREIMEKDVVTLAPEMALKEAADLLEARQISGAPVVSGAGEILGVLSFADIARYEVGEPRVVVSSNDFYRRTYLAEPALKSGFSFGATDEGRVRDAMTPVIVSVSPEAPVREVAQIMLDRHVHRVLVTEGAKLKGIVSTMDLLALLAGGGTVAHKRR